MLGVADLMVWGRYLNQIIHRQKHNSGRFYPPKDAKRKTPREEVRDISSSRCHGLVLDRGNFYLSKRDRCTNERRNSEFAPDFSQNLEAVLSSSFKCLATDHPNCFGVSLTLLKPPTDGIQAVFVREMTLRGKGPSGLITQFHSNQRK